MRLSSRKGFTIGEMMVAVMILLMVSSVVAAGIPAAARAYYKVMDSANAQMLLSTTVTRLRAELSTATEVTIGTADDGTAEGGAVSDSTTIEYRSASGSISRITLRKPVEDEGTDDDIIYGIYVERTGMTGEQLLVSLKAASGMYMTYSSVAKSASDAGVLIFSDLAVHKGDKVLTQLETYEVRVLSAGLKDNGTAG